MRPTHWFSWFGSSLRRRRPQAPTSKIFEFRAFVESLEDRMAPAVFTVLNTADSGAGSFRQAILDANSAAGADTIDFDATVFATPQIITLASGVLTLTDSALTSITGPGQALVTVSGNNADRVMIISAGASASLSDLTITKGVSTGRGGGVKNEGTLTMTDCAVTGSSTSDRGGGLANYAGGIVTLTNCTFSGNKSGFQGGGLQNLGKMTITSSYIHSNTVTGSGGGINAQGAGPLIVVDTTISGNSVSGSGGGIAANGAVTLTGCTISGNTSGGTGGGILEYSSTMTATNCTITGNTSGTSGGGFYMRFGSLTLRNVTITANKANAGGGVNNTSGGNFTIRNTIVSANTAATGKDINGTITTDNGTNLFGAALSGTTFGTGNIFTDVAVLVPLANYGGPTKTMIPFDGSPAIGSGDNTGGPATDQRGFARPVGVGGNIGAVEGIGYNVLNTNDSGPGSLRQAVIDANTATSADAVLFSSLFVTAQTITLTGGQIDLTDDLTTMIIGPGANLLAVSGNNANRLFEVVLGGAADISGMKITEGKSGLGGGVRNDGTLTMTAVLITGNAGDFGGGFCNTGTATVSSSTFSANTAVHEGGGLQNYGVLTVTNSTVYANSSVRGGGMTTAGGGTTNLNNCTFSGNTASATGGGMENIGSTVTLKNTIVATQAAGNDIGGTVSGSNNLISTLFSGGLVNGVAGNLVNVASPGLAAPGNNGGATPTIALLPTSPALNAGFAGNAPATDQRGQTRFGSTDIGAYEYLFKVVTTTDTTDLGTLRKAILSANAEAGTDTIVFRIPGTGVQTIAVTSGGVPGLPVITEATIIDGWSQGGPTYTGSPLIELDGTLATNGVIGSFGLNIQASSTTVRGLAINRFPNVNGNGYGIGVFSAVDNVWLYGNYIGTNAAGTAAAANGQGGIWIGGTATGVIIGTNADSTNDAAERNVISGNAGKGIRIDGSANIVAGNFIGIDVTGSGALANTGAGVFLNNAASLNMIGGTTAAARNIISGNTSYGVDVNAGNNTVAGNYIGTNAAGTAAVGNGDRAVYIHNGATGVTVGGTTAGARNVISGNTGDSAVFIGNASNNTVAGNYIGTNAAGTAAIANTGTGVIIDNGASGNIIGGTAAGTRNVISGNDFAGVRILGSGTTGNVVSGNYIGTDPTGTAKLGNGTFGVLLLNANANTVGGLTAAARNIISGNLSGGVSISGTTAVNNFVQGNFIGLDATGANALGNPNFGIVFASGANNNTVGGPTVSARNVISANLYGVFAANAGTTNNIIQGNYIGTDATGTKDRGNTLSGIQIQGVPNHTIADNLISGNDNYGINILLAGATGNVIRGNMIGSNATATAGLPNLFHGIALQDVSGNTVGGTAIGAGNAISYNMFDGVAVLGTASDNSIRGNLIHSNGGLGIDLGNDGVTANDASGHTGPNNYQNFPVLSFVLGGATTRPNGTLNAAPNKSFLLDFYASEVADASGFGEGKRYLGSTSVLTNALGQAKFSAVLASATTTSEVVSVTATDSDGNTSEFSQSVLTDILPTVNLTTPPQALIGITLPFTPVLSNTLPGNTYRYTWSVTFNTTTIALPNSSFVSDGATDQETFFFTPQRVGTYVLSVKVTDSRGGETTATSNAINVSATTLGVTIMGNPLGTPAPFAIVSGTPVTLTHVIADPRETAVDPKTGASFFAFYSYAWNVTRDGLPFALPTGTVTTASTLTFTPTAGGLYYASLAVNDGTLAAGTDSVSMYNTDEPSAQIIVTPGTAVTAGTRVNLQTVVTDVALRRSLTYAWTITPDNSQPAITANNSTGVFAFTATAAGNYMVSVTVTDDENRSGVSSPVQIRVNGAAPVLTISGAPFTSAPGAPVTLTGSVTDADPNQPGSGSTNTYTLSWSAITSAGAVTPATGAGSTYTFTPTASGTVVVSLMATDQNGFKTSVPAVINVAGSTRTLTVTPPANPTQGQSLTWTASLAPVAAGTTYSWRVFSPDGITSTFNTGTISTLTLPGGALPGRYDMRVTATANGSQYIAEAPAAGTFVVVPHSPINVAITVSAPVPPQTSNQEGDTVTLTGFASEPGVDLTNLSKASYLWTVTGPGGFFQAGVLPTLRVQPLIAGTYTASLTVRDFTGGVGVATTTFAIAHVPPKPILRYLNTGADGTIGLQAFVSNPNGSHAFTYSVQLNGQPFIQPTPGGTAFTFRVPPLAAATLVNVSVTDSVNATSQLTATLRAIAPGTAAAPVQKVITSADLLPGSKVVVALATGHNQIFADASLTAATTVEFVAVGGNNKFYGGPSTNIFQGDSGTNEMTGGSGPNTFFGSGNDTMIGGSGANQYVPVTVDTSTGNVLNVTAGSGANAIDLSQQHSVSLDLSVTGAAQSFDGNGNSVMLTGQFQNVLGSSGADTLTAASGANIVGGGGNDLLKSNGANDVTLSAGSGNATLQATGGSNITMLGGKDTDLLTATNVFNASLVGGSGNNDTLVAGFGSENIDLVGGSGNNDSLIALDGSSNIRMIGGSGHNDSLVAGFGSENVSMVGGSGNNDSLIALDGSRNISMIGGSGHNDSLVAMAGAENITMVGGSGNNDSLIARSGSTNVSMIGGSGNNDSLVAEAGAVNVRMVGGSGNNDSLIALDGSSNITMIGGSGHNDSLVAMAGAENVSMVGGSGNNDSLIALDGSSNITMVGGSGHNDSLVAFGDNISLVGGSGNNDSLLAMDGSTDVTLVGGSGSNDSLVAMEGSERVLLVGGSGNNDSLVALSRDVTLIGGSGHNDSLVAGRGAENVSLIGGSGHNDTLVAMDGSFDVSLVGGSGSNDSLVALAGSERVLLVGGSGNNDSLVALSRDVTLIGGSGHNDSLVAADGAVNVQMVGGSGHNDTLVAMDGSVNVSMIGGSGSNDSLVAMDGSVNVSMVGGSGNNDTLVARGGSENVSLVGGSGSNDSLVAEAGARNVSMVGGSGNNDTLVARDGSANVSMVGGSGHNDSLYAGANSVNISLVGGSGSNDTLVAGPGSINVTLVGGSGNNDSLVAIDATDVSLIGGSGNGTRLSVINTAGAILLGGMGSNLSLSASGTSSNVVLIGGFGNNDSLSAGAGVNGAQLVGGFGDNDVLEATGATNALLVGGYGNNVSLTATNSTNVTLVGGFGDNAYLRRIGGNNAYLLGQSGNNDSLISTGGGDNVSLVGGSGNNLYLSDTGSNHVSLLGGSGHNDTVVSTNGTNVTVFGGNGDNDSVSASGGKNVFVIGGTGSGNRITTDFLTDATVFGGAGNSNVITNSHGKNLLVIGGTGIANVLTDINGTSNTMVNGGNRLASLVASGGNSVRLFGGGGTDYLSASGGTNIGLFGENGDNTYAVSGTAANPFSGYLDALGTVGLDQSSTDQLSSGTNTILFPTADQVTLDLSVFVGGAATASAAASATQQVATDVSFYLIGMFSGVVGSATGNDYIQGNALQNSLVAGAGNSTLVAGSGDATLVAGAGNDSLVGGSGRTSYVFRDAAAGHHTITQANPNNVDVVDFSKLSSPAVLNLSKTTSQTVAGPLSLTLTFPTLSDVIGSPFGNTITGNSRDNHITLSTGNNTVTTGNGLTTLKFTGSTLGTNAITAPALSSVVFNFHELARPLSINLSQPTQFVAGGTVSFTSAIDSRAVAAVVGTVFSDNLIGNAAPGAPGVSLYGGGGRDSLVGGAGDDFLQAGVSQVVLLDFDTYTPLSAGNHIYTQVERDAIQQRLERVYSAFASTGQNGATVHSNGYVFAQNLAAARTLTRLTGGEFITIYFNKPPVGGQAEEVDFANTGLGGTASVDASLILGAADQPDPTTENYINLSAGLAAHELAHLAGLRHTDAFGPIGSGAYQVFMNGSQVAGINPSLFVPSFEQPFTAQSVVAGSSFQPGTSSIPFGATVYAIETPLHIMGSPASMGISRFDTLNDLFFGEREAIRLAFSQSGVILLSQTALHDSQATAQDLGALPGLVVPNTLAAIAFNADESFAVSAVAVVGSIGLDGTGRSRSDWYSFAGHAGEIMSFETISNVLPGNANPLDTILCIFDAAGNLLATNDDELESRDSIIFDFEVPADGKYFVKVDTFAENPAANTSQGDYVLYMTSFKIGASTGGGSTLVAGPGHDILYGGQGNNLFRLAPNITGPVTVIPGNGADILDRTAAPLAAVTIITQTQNTSLTQLLGTPPALQFPAGLATQTITKGGLLHFSAAVTNPGRSVTYSLAPALGQAPGGASIRSTDGEFNWTAGSQGTYQIVIVATASDGATAATTVTILVTAVAPALNPVEDQSAPVGTPVQLHGSVINPVAAETYNFVWTVTRNSLPVATFFGQDASFNPGISGTFAVVLTVTNQQDGLSSSTAATVAISEVAPVVNPLPAATIPAGGSTSFTASYFYPGDPGTLTTIWTVTNSANVNVPVTNSAGTNFTFTAPDADVYTVRFTVQTASGVLQFVTTQVTAVSVPPTATPPAGINIAEGTAATLAFTNPFSPASAVMAAGFRYSFALMPGLLASNFNAASTSASYLFTGNDVGTFTVYGRIFDKNNAYRDYTMQVVVVNVAIVPVGSGLFTATKGTSTGTMTVATFTDAGGPEALSRYAASIDWGDGTSSPGTIGAPIGGAFPVRGSHTYSTQGNYTIRVSVAHDNLPPVTVTSLIAVTAPALVGAGVPQFSATKAADTGSILLATFTDPTGPDAPGTYAATINWGNGTTSSGVISQNGSTFNVTGNHTYLTTGNRTITVTLKHQGSPDVEVLDSAVVINPALVALATGIAATRNSPTGLVAVATFTDPGGPDSLASYSATINWGDGSSTIAGTITLGDDGRTFSVLGEHTYSVAGSYPITVTVQHGTAPPAPATAISTATVSIPAVSLSYSPVQAIVAALPTNLLVATFLDPSGADASSSYSAMIDWGDGTPTTSGMIGAPVNGVFPVLGSHTYTSLGAFTITVTVVHGASPPATASGSVSLSWGQVTATGGFTPAFAAALPSSPVVATFIDPYGTGPVSRYSAIINWGDGTSSTGIISGPVGGVFSVSAPHSYFVLGTVPITVMIARGTGVPVTVTSTASVGTSIFALNPTLSASVSLKGSPVISIGGALVINSVSNSALSASGHPHITAGSIRIVGGYSASGTAQITPTPITHGAAIADPLAALPVPANPGGTPINSVISGNTTVTLNPGRYSQIRISGSANVTLNPGVYVISGGGFTVSGNATIAGTGVLIYVAGSNYPSTGGTFGGISFSGSPNVALWPAATGTYAGITFFQARDNNLAITFSGNAQSGINGFLYAPKALLNLSGSIATVRMGVIVDRLNTSGNASSSLASAGSVTEDGEPAGELLSTSLSVYVNDPFGEFTAAERARITAAITSLDELIAIYNVDVFEVNDPATANVVIDLAPTTILGGMAQGVLGAFDPVNGVITLVDGWNWFAGSDSNTIGALQFDFQTVVTHELGHALGLGHLPMISSVMHDSLAPSVAKRSILSTDLNVGNEHGLPGALYADLSGMDSGNRAGQTTSSAVPLFERGRNVPDLLPTVAAEHESAKTQVLADSPQTVESSRMSNATVLSRQSTASENRGSAGVPAADLPVDGDTGKAPAEDSHAAEITIASPVATDGASGLVGWNENELLGSVSFGLDATPVADIISDTMSDLVEQIGWGGLVLLGVLTAGVGTGGHRRVDPTLPGTRRDRR